jgi:hypothetical protein
LSVKGSLWPSLLSVYIDVIISDWWLFELLLSPGDSTRSVLCFVFFSLFLSFLLESLTTLVLQCVNWIRNLCWKLLYYEDRQKENDKLSLRSSINKGC